MRSVIMAGSVLRYTAFPAAGPDGGNPAGVVLDAAGLADADMLAIAAEVGYSETAFVLPGDGPRSFALRYFSPLGEVGFCGHATIATAVALAERNGPGQLSFTIGPGRLGVRTARDDTGAITATLTSVPTRTRAATEPELRPALDALRWTSADLDARYPPHVSYAGNDHLVLAVRSRATLAALDYDYDRLATVMADAGWTTVHVVWAEAPLLFHARDPFPPGGVREDPATGAAAAAFGGYLRELGLVPVPSRVVVRQGEDLGRSSELLVDISAARTVDVTGRALPISSP
jgi:PhzF family phenazine biosynthesis protein